MKRRLLYIAVQNLEADVSVTFAENNITQENIDAAQLLVNELIPGIVRRELQARLDALVIVGDTVPDPPIITNVVTTSDPSQYAISITNQSNGGQPIIGYRVEYRTDGDWIVDIANNESGEFHTIYTSAGLPTGTIEFRVFAINSVGTSAASNIFTYDQVSNNPPTAPTGVFGVFLPPNGITRGWSGATSDAGIAGYNYYIDGVKQNDVLIDDGIFSFSGTTGASWQTFGLSPSTQYTELVEVVDVNGLTASKERTFTTNALDTPVSRIEYDSVDTPSGKHFFFQIYKCPGYLTNPSRSFRTALWFGGIGTNGYDDVSKMINDDGYPNKIHNGTDFDYNIVSVQQTGGQYTGQNLDEIFNFLQTKIFLDNRHKKGIVIGWSGGHMPFTALKYKSIRVKVAICIDLSYDTPGPATTAQTLENGSKIWLFVAANGSFVGGFDTYWNAIQASQYFDVNLQRYTKFATGGHNIINKILDNTGGALYTPDDGYTPYPGTFTIHDLIME